MSRPGFLVLPDLPAAAGMLGRAWAGVQVHAHASGRPWLVGRWRRAEVAVGTAGPVRLAVIGDSPVAAVRLGELAARVSSLADVDRVAAALSGAFHLVATVDGAVRIQGTATGLRRVFHCRAGGVPVAADRADLLAGLAESSVDEETLAARMACGLQLPPPLNERPLYAKVSAVPPGDCLVWTDGRAREKPWWRPPAARESLTRGAEGVRAALADSVHLGRGSADLSGGMDSTSLCFLAARENPELLTLRWAEAEAGNDDAEFAARSIAALDRAEHVIIPQHELPAVFAGPDRPMDADEPYAFTRSAARIRYSAETVAAHGSETHFAGHGGDELFSPLPGYLHQLLRRRPVTALRHVRAHAALRRWPLFGTAAGLLRPGTVAGWWREQASHLADPVGSARRPVLGWGVEPLRAQPWLTGDALHLARKALHRTADQARPLGRDPGEHQAMLVLRSAAAQYRLTAGLFADAGVQLRLPFFDDRVVEAVLRVRRHEHADPARYKPLLAEAMRGIVPDVVLGRATKGEFGADLRDGLRRNQAAILRLFEDSALAARGLLDPDRLRAAVLAPQRDYRVVAALEPLIGCEMWLRAADRPAPRRLDALAP
ncbi:asparagine synthase-related protein [Amycolatopsis silviterrae]|uniref:asparagine synthase (glutamine-hydrolyzing) n=1 Tax=Amycolatopsis silviterrae TaxID=1656914 RepID=A0ABW5HI62_9PSEU